MEAGRQLEPTTSRDDVVLHGATQFSLQIGCSWTTRLLDPIVCCSVGADNKTLKQKAHESKLVGRTYSTLVNPTMMGILHVGRKLTHG
jgi:hypothetical protein